jgi:adenosylcobinamide kinase/adenosylcobinamide-phosphate guanylyltransferase
MDQARTIMLVLGGVRSGKSRYALTEAARFSRVTFVATAERSDAEMRRKIAVHRRERPSAWSTVEAPTNLDRIILREGPTADLLLVDCLTVYCGSLLSRDRVRESRQRHLDAVVEAIHTTAASVFVVSNEVGSGIVPAFTSGRVYRHLLGELNQQVARVSDTVVLLVAGVPVTIKGAL